MRIDWFWPIAAALVIVVVLATRVIDYDFVFYSGYLVLTYLVLATAWNILGGFTGYVNFGSAAFFAPEIATRPSSLAPPSIRSLSTPT